MKSQQALNKFYQSPFISNYSTQTINSFMSALNNFFKCIVKSYSIDQVLWLSMLQPDDLSQIAETSVRL